MSTISARVEADSISPSGQRLTTFVLKYPRIIHSELMTHRVFSRNASSSRAIPVDTMLNDILKDTAFPVRWGVNKPGMQDGGELSAVECDFVQEVWFDARDNAIKSVQKLLRMPNQPHKQVVNRLLEPFMHINVVCSATNYSNWFALRRHKDADPTIQRLAKVMWRAFEKLDKPAELSHGDWHLPFVTGETVSDVAMWVSENLQSGDAKMYARSVTNICKEVSAARCARASYNNHDGTKPDVAKDVALFERLTGNLIKHASPTEHQATPDEYVSEKGWQHPHLHGNFNGWIQHRKTLSDEYIGDQAYSNLDKEGFFDAG